MTIVAVIWAAGARGRAATPEMASTGGTAADVDNRPLGVAPPLDGIPLREQFTRLDDRIMAAAEVGDTATVIRFWQMAAGAYDNLSPTERDIDARFHMATLHLLVGRIPATLALADTILAESPGNLMGWYLRGVAAEFEGDSATAREARQQFRAGFETEMARQLPEYVEHAPQLRAFLDQATP